MERAMGQETQSRYDWSEMVEGMLMDRLEWLGALKEGAVYKSARANDGDSLPGQSEG
jgi:hypothetical protein